MFRICHRMLCLSAVVVILTYFPLPCSARDIGFDIQFDIQDVSQTVAEKFRNDFRHRKRVLEQYFVVTRFVTPFSGQLGVNVIDYSPPVYEELLTEWWGRDGHMYVVVSQAIAVSVT